MLSATRGLAAGADDVLITRGSQMALDLAARALLRPGDLVAVEELGYRRAWDAIVRAGATPGALPVDSDGVDVDALEALCARRPRARALPDAAPPVSVDGGAVGGAPDRAARSGAPRSGWRSSRTTTITSSTSRASR